jgi:diguanylate cyclase (GGDEF)-like protein
MGLTMALRRRFESIWDGGVAPAPVRTLATMGLIGGLCCLLAAAFPADPEAPIGLLRVSGVVVLLASATILWIGDRMPPWGLHLSAAIGTLGISLVITQSATGLGMIVTACAYIWICVYAGFFFTRVAARFHMALIATAFGAALLISDVSVPIDAWVFMTVSLVIAGETLGRQSGRLRHQAHTDALTGVLNRKGLETATNRVFSLADRTGIPLTVAVIDLDNFKQVNDRDGHAAGDRLLINLTRIWSEEIEPSDIFARLGGDEFLLILVGSAEEESARLLDRLRFLSPTPWSDGVVMREPEESLSRCLARADSALYETKHARTAERGVVRRPAPSPQSSPASARSS